MVRPSSKPPLRGAFLTMRDPGDFVTDYTLSIEPMRALGWQVTLVDWRDRTIDWNAFDAVYICTPWDYLQDPELFVRVLRGIDASRAELVNSLALVEWSLEKSYLKDLEQRGAAIVPSRWFKNFDAADIEHCFDLFNADRLVLKPLIGANAIDTFVICDPIPETLCDELTKAFSERPFFVQPFIENICAEGEFSLFFLGGTYSHAIQKIPKAGDFRVQEEHGADIRAIDPPDTLISIATEVIAMVEPASVYARIDLVRDSNDTFRVMELELIEPSLYLRTNNGAAGRFARAFDNYVRSAIQGGKPSDRVRPV